MPQGATLVNTARKEVIDEAGLVKALEEYRPEIHADIAAGNQTALTEKFWQAGFRDLQKDGGETAEANINAGLPHVIGPTQRQGYQISGQ